MTDTVLFIDESVPAQNIVKNCLTTNVQVIEHLEDALKITNVTKFAIMYRNTGYHSIPFMKSSYQMNWYSDQLIAFFESLKKNGVNEVDLITCSLNDPRFINETTQLSERLQIAIEYSTNQTGNGNNSDWILESNHKSLIGCVLTPDITTQWHHKLDVINILTTPTEILNFFNNPNAVSPTHALTYEHHKYTLHHDVILSSYYDSTLMETILVQLQLNNGEIFDGHKHKITLTYNIDGLFNINSSTQSTTIKNLTIDSTVTITAGGNGAGGIIRPEQSKFTVENCVIMSQINISSTGGICGMGCNNFTIKECINRSPSSINYAVSGGICGALCSNATICECTNYSPIMGSNSQSSGCGGIAGGGCYDMSIIRCKNYGGNYSVDGGGIVGTDFAAAFDTAQSGTTAGAFSYSGNSKIIKCTNYGKLYATNSAGICGSELGYSAVRLAQKLRSTVVTIKKCCNKGKIMTADAFGICGTKCGYATFSNQYITSIQANQVLPKQITFDAGLTIKIIKCYAKYGEIIGSSALYGDSSDLPTTMVVTYIGPELYIIDTYTKGKDYLIDSINPWNYSRKAYYIDTQKHIKVNLLTHPSYISRKN